MDLFIDFLNKGWDEIKKKPNGFAEKLAEILDVEVIAPTEKISVDDFGGFIHDKKGKFITFKKD